MRVKKRIIIMILAAGILFGSFIGLIITITGEEFGVLELIRDVGEYRDDTVSETVEKSYYYQQLDTDGKRAYERIYEGMWNEEECIRLYFIGEEELDETVNMVLSDHPELFYYGNHYQYICYGDYYTACYPTYSYTREERKEKEKEIETASKKALAAVDRKASEYEQVKDVYEYLILNVDYEEDVPDNQNMYSALVNKKTVCAGYASAAQYLLSCLGIEAIYVSGEVEGESHAWNIVNIDDRYYHVDATYGDRADGEEKEGPVEYLCDYNYLCFDDSEMKKDRTIDQLGSIPACGWEDLQYFRLQGKYYERYEEDIWKQVEAEVEKGEQYWECKFETKEEYEKMLKEVEKGERYIDLVLSYLDRTMRSYRVTTWYSYDETAYTICCWYEVQ